MKITNLSRYPTERVREIIHWVETGLSSNMPCTVVNCLNVYRGYYKHGAGIQLYLGGPHKFPATGCHYTGRGEKFPYHNLSTWEDALVLITAHELEHNNQYRKMQRDLIKFAASHTPIEAENWKRHHRWYNELKAERKAARVLQKWKAKQALMKMKAGETLTLHPPSVCQALNSRTDYNNNGTIVQ